jgi:hypothetical protein
MSRTLSPWPWIAAGAAFAAYPALRPYADETTLAGLAAMASNRWLLAHLLGMLAFALVPLALLTLRPLVPGSRAGRSAVALAALAAALLLPYYGGEAYGLHAIGRRAVATGDLSLLGVVDGFRYQPVAITTFGLGLLAVAVAGVLAAVADRHRDVALRVSVGVVALGLALYLPQFYAPPGLRIAHGFLLGLGCWAVAARLARTDGGAADRPSYRVSARPGSVVERAATKAS